MGQLVELAYRTDGLRSSVKWLRNLSGPLLGEYGLSAQSFHPKIGGARLYANVLERILNGWCPLAAMPIACRCWRAARSVLGAGLWLGC
ncbi:hypothetical protein, partial [Streptomyces sp. N2A]|uniref:hypothetical protein n=1 Tax=Streptomyces sp. N2A TaxID=3073936 RepID=UPI00286FF0BE